MLFLAMVGSFALLEVILEMRKTAPGAVTPEVHRPLPNLDYSSPASVGRPKDIPPDDPLELPGFSRMSATEKIDVILKLSTNTHLSAKTSRFLTSQMQSTSNSALLRNVAANTLVSQANRDPSLYRMFISMIEDPSESLAWREYAIQFLALCLDSATDRQEAEQALWRASTSKEGVMGATALLQLHRLNQQGIVDLGPAFGQRLEDLVAQESLAPESKVTILGIAGERKLRSALPTIRPLVRDLSPSIRRAAVAFLGTMGDPLDLDLVNSAKEDSDPLVVKAAMAASQRLAAISSEP
ncbi:MAG: HEAT repeat domain-containing protein [Planctomycetes bacterium]|nr:HEAT repeat domain-containing protein [Planctomycetota bacterium]